MLKYGADIVGFPLMEFSGGWSKGFRKDQLIFVHCLLKALLHSGKAGHLMTCNSSRLNSKESNIAIPSFKH